MKHPRNTMTNQNNNTLPTGWWSFVVSDSLHRQDYDCTWPNQSLGRVLVYLYCKCAFLLWLVVLRIEVVVVLWLEQTRVHAFPNDVVKSHTHIFFYVGLFPFVCLVDVEIDWRCGAQEFLTQLDWLSCFILATWLPYLPQNMDGCIFDFRYFNTLTFGGLMTAYLLWRGMTLETVGFWRGVRSFWWHDCFCVKFVCVLLTLSICESSLIFNYLLIGVICIGTCWYICVSCVYKTNVIGGHRNVEYHSPACMHLGECHFFSCGILQLLNDTTYFWSLHKSDRIMGLWRCGNSADARIYSGRNPRISWWHAEFFECIVSIVIICPRFFPSFANAIQHLCYFWLH